MALRGFLPGLGSLGGGGCLSFSLAFSAPLHLASAPRLGVKLWLQSPPPLLSVAKGSRPGTWGQESKQTLGQGLERTVGVRGNT